MSCSNLLNADFLLDLFFGPDDESDMFFETSVDFQRTTRRYIPESQVFHCRSVRRSGKWYVFNFFWQVIVLSSPVSTSLGAISWGWPLTDPWHGGLTASRTHVSTVRHKLWGSVHRPTTARTNFLPGNQEQCPGSCVVRYSWYAQNMYTFRVKLN
jgi:hypothetical protein